MDAVGIQAGNITNLATVSPPEASAGSFDALAYNIGDGYLYGVLSGPIPRVYAIAANENVSMVADLPSGVS